MRYNDNNEKYWLFRTDYFGLVKYFFLSAIEFDNDGSEVGMVENSNTKNITKSPP